MSYSSPKPLPYVPADITIGYVSADNPFMAAAREQALMRSQGCKLRLGGVLTRNDEIIGRGVNCSETVQRPAFCVRDVLSIPSGQGYDLCPNCAGSHCEPPTIANAHANNEDTDGSTFYLYGHWWCCEPCCNAMRAAGVREVKLLEGATELFGSPQWELPKWPQTVHARITTAPDVDPATAQLLQVALGRANIEMVAPDFTGPSITLDLELTPTHVSLNGMAEPYPSAPLLLTFLASRLPQLIHEKS